jgi:hypothetical protein
LLGLQNPTNNARIRDVNTSSTRALLCDTTSYRPRAAIDAVIAMETGTGTAMGSGIVMA